jgi:multidrug resistance protein, MATE family
MRRAPARDPRTAVRGSEPPGWRGTYDGAMLAVLAREVPSLLRIALPLALAQLALNAMGLVDTLMVGRLGPADLAGIALGAMAFFFVTIVASAAMFAVAPLVAQASGAGRPADAAEAGRHGLVLGALIAPPVMLLLYVVGPLMGLLGQEADTAARATGYLRAVLWGVPAYMLIVPLRSFLEGRGETRPVMLIAFVAVGLNVLANNALMFGRWGFPALGLVGTGYATAFVYSAMATLLTLYVVRRESAHPVVRWAPVVRDRLAEVARLGWPIALTVAFETGLFGVTAFLMGLFSQPQLAGHQVAIQSASFTFMIPLALGVATSVRVGQAVGREHASGARTAGVVGMGLAVGFMCLTAVLFWTAPRAVIGLYLDLGDPVNAAVIAHASAFLRIAAMFQLVDGLQVAAIGALRGLKDTRVPMFITLVAYWPIGLGLGVYLAFGAGMQGVGLWYGLVAGLAVAAVWLTSRFSTLVRRLRWRRGG